MSKRMPNKMNFAMFSRRLAMGFSLIIICFGLAGFNNISKASTSHYLVREHIVLDLRSGVEWLRCSVGQIYNRGMCEGEILKLPYQDVAEAIKLANKELGGRWRLPTRDELSLLLCAECPPPRIEKVIFRKPGPSLIGLGRKTGWCRKITGQSIL